MMGPVVCWGFSSGLRRSDNVVANYERRFEWLRNEEPIHSVLALLRWSQAKIFDLQKKLVWKKKETERLLFHAFGKWNVEKRRADRLNKRLMTEKEKNEQLQGLLGKAKETINYWWGKAEKAMRRVRDLEIKVTASDGKIKELVTEKKELQREVNVIRKLPKLEERYKELKKEEAKEEMKRVGMKVGNAFLGTLPGIALTAIVTTLFGSIGLVVTELVPVGAVIGASVEVPEDPRKEERGKEIKNLHQKITYIRTGMES